MLVEISSLAVHKVYSERQIAIVESNNNLQIINYKSGEIKKLDIKRVDFYDIETVENCVLQVSEAEVSISCGDRFVMFYPNDKGYRFLLCKFFDANGVKYILVLSSSNADSSTCKIERYTLDVNLFS